MVRACRLDLIWLSVCSKTVLWQNGRLDPDAVWDDDLGRSRDGYIRWGGDRRREGQFGYPIVITGPLRRALLKLLRGLVVDGIPVERIRRRAGRSIVGACPRPWRDD